MSCFTILKEFKEQIIIFIDELIDQFPLEGDLIAFRFFIKDRSLIEDLMNDLIVDLLPFKSMAKNKDEKFFLENRDVFKHMDQSRVLHFKKLWKSGTLDEDDKHVIWTWVDLFLNMAERYKEAKKSG